MHTLKKFIQYYAPYKAVFFLDLICAAIISLADLSLILGYTQESICIFYFFSFSLVPSTCIDSSNQPNWCLPI